MAEDRLEKMKAIAAQAKAEKEAKALEEAERSKAETEAKGAEREQVEQELTTASQELAGLESQLSEAEKLTSEMAESSEDALKEFNAELDALRTEAATLKERMDDLNARKQQLDAELGSESESNLEPESENEPKSEASAEADTPVEPVAESTTEEPSTEKEIEDAFESSKQEIIAQAQAKIDSTEGIPEDWKAALKDLIKRKDISHPIFVEDLERIADPEIEQLMKEKKESDATLMWAHLLVEDKGTTYGSSMWAEQMPKDLRDKFRQESSQIVLDIDYRRPNDGQKVYDRKHDALKQKYIELTKQAIPTLLKKNFDMKDDFNVRKNTLKQSDAYKAMESTVEDSMETAKIQLQQAVEQRQESIDKLKAKTETKI